MMGFPGDTSMGAGAGFRSTIWECLEKLKGPEGPESKEAFDQIVRWYWKPVYRCVRVGWNKSNEDAKDLTQAFFLSLLDRGSLAAADPARGKFRAFIKSSLRNFLATDHRNARTVKRGRDVFVLPQDFQTDPPDLPAQGSTPEEVLDAEWARSLFSTALERLKEDLKARPGHFEVFEACDLHPPDVAAPTQEDLATRFGRPQPEIKRILKECRSHLRDLVVQEIRKYVQSDDEAWEELEFLMARWS